MKRKPSTARSLKRLLHHIYLGTSASPVAGKHAKHLAVLILILGAVYSAPAELPTPIAAYRFLGTAKDETTNANDGQGIGPVLTSDRFGNTNAAYNFVKLGDYVDLGRRLKSPFPMAITVWFKSTSFALQQTLFRNDSWDYPGAYFGVTLNIETDGKFSVGVGNGTISDPTGRKGRTTLDSVITPNAWHHVGVVITNADNAAIYVDGVERPTFSAGSSDGRLVYSANFPAVLGWRGGVQFPAQFYGMVDDLYVYSQALSPEQVLESFSALDPDRPSLSVVGFQDATVIVRITGPATTPFGTTWLVEHSPDLAQWTRVPSMEPVEFLSPSGVTDASVPTTAGTAHFYRLRKYP